MCRQVIILVTITTMNNFLAFLLFFFSVLGGSAQERTKFKVSSPLGIPLEVAGSFSEVRSNHFHSGIDFRTGGKEGEPVYAIADGYVSRIKISATGYGKAVYITHPEGYTSVYAHLQKLNPQLDSLLRLQHVKAKSYELDWYPDKGLIPIKRGDWIAFSGNTGGSAGPHLHFEIRDAATENSLNPLQFGLKVQDTLAPQFESFCIWNSVAPSGLEVDEINRFFKFTNGVGSTDTLPVVVKQGELQIAVSVIDKYLSTSGDCGIQRLRMYFDGMPVYDMQLKEVNFSQTKAVNGFAPLGIYKAHHAQWYRCSKPITWEAKDIATIWGIPIMVEDSLVHSLRFEATDWSNHTSIDVAFLQAKGLEKPLSDEDEEDLVFAGEETTLDFKHGKLKFQMESLFDDVVIKIHEVPTPEGMYNGIEIGHEGIGLYKPAVLDLSLKNVPSHLVNQLGVVRYDGHDWNWVGGKSVGDFFQSNVSSLGIFALAVDLNKPSIQRGEMVLPDSTLDGYIEFRIFDSESGISKITPTVNAEWQYYEHDAKSNTVRVYLNKQWASEEERTFKFVVRDGVGNESVFEMKL